MDRHTVQELSVVLLRGLGQLALVETALGGALVLAAIALINPWSALGAVTGVILGTAVGYRDTGVSRDEWRSGHTGFNSAVIGIMAGGFISTDSDWIGAVALAAVLCLSLEFVMRKILLRWTLPVLTLPAVISLLLTSLLLAPIGTWLWVSPGPSALGELGIILAILCVVLAMAIKSLSATLQLVILICVAVLACRQWGIDPLTMPGLWAFTIAPASFTVHAVFMGGSLLGGVAGCAAAAISVCLWLLWYWSGLGDVIPPLLAPFILGVWCTLLIFRRLGQPAILQPEFWQALATLAKARLKGKRVVVIITNTPDTGSQSAPASPEVGKNENFAESRKARYAWWQTCHGFREKFENLAPESFHCALARLQRHHWLETIITFAMDGRLQRAGAKPVVEAQGRLETVRCLGCRGEHQWPPANIWRSCDLFCSECGDLMMPGPPGLKEVIDATRLAITQSLGRDGVLMVLGTLEDSRAVRIIFGEARLRNAHIINITPEPSSTPLGAGEILVRGKVDSTVRCFARILVPWSLTDPLPGIRFAHARTESGRDNP